jgi:hypothetical protein
MGRLCHFHLAHFEYFPSHFPVLLDLFSDWRFTIRPHSTRPKLCDIFNCSNFLFNLLTSVLLPGVGSGFDSFPRTFLTLSNLVSGEDWDNHFDDVSVQYP